MILIEHLRGLGLSSREARAALETGKVRLRGVPTADAGRDVDPADVTVDPRAPRLVPGRDPVVLHRDEHLAVVWKPAGMLSVPAPGRREPNLLAFVGRFGRALAVHRLDEETSGVMLVALDERTQTALKDAFEAHDVERSYQAIARGAVPDRWTVANTLVRDRGDGLRGSGPGGKPATTHFRRVEPLRGASLVEATLETGRTHQVRIHLAEAGHPILGDPLYADRGTRGRAPRLALHAVRLGFVHPRTGERMRFEVPLADDLERLRRDLQGGVGPRRSAE